MSPSTVPASVERLNNELSAVGVLYEICATAGVVSGVVLSADPPTRNVRALFQSRHLVDEAIRRVRTDLALPERWLEELVRGRMARDGVMGTIELSNLRAFDAPASYLLAMKAAALSVNDSEEDREAIRSLLRHLGLETVEAALARINGYFSERQLPPDLAARLDALIAG